MTESLEKEDVQEFSLRQTVHLLFDEIKAVNERLSEIEDTLVQMNNGR